MKCARHFILAALASTLSTGALAQWKPMREVVFDSAAYGTRGNAADRKLMEQVWAKELAQQRSATQGKPLPAFTLVGEVKVAGRQLVFSMFNASSSPRCEDAPNGANESDVFTVCQMRVTAWPVSAARPAELPGYCMFFGSAADDGRNRIEYQLVGTQIHFRAIQYGQIVEACNKTLRLQ